MSERSMTEWWLDRVAFAPMHWAQGRNAAAKITAMSVGTVWALGMMAVGFPLLFADIMRGMYRELGKPK